MPDDVREAALRLLDYQDRSVGELKDRLKKKSYPPEEIEAVVASLQESGIVDDRRYASLFVQSKTAAGKGRIYIVNKLKEKKISPEIIRLAVEEVLEEEDECVLCLKKALSVCGLSERFEIDENGEIVPVTDPFFGSFGEEFSESERIGYFEPKEESVRRNRQACRAYREKAKAKVTRRLISAGFPPGLVFDAVRRIENL